MIKQLFSLRRLMGLFLWFTVLAGGMVAGAMWRLHHDAPSGRGVIASDSAAVQMVAQREGEVTHLMVDNKERSEITMTFEFAIRNLKADVQFPYTATFPPGRSPAFNLEPDGSGEKWEYAYTNYYKMGSSVAVPDDYVYALPYQPGSAHRVTQGYNGTYSHKDSNQYAIDWQMREGTPVYAARGGLVVKVKDDSNKGGGDISYDQYNNYVLIRHSDGTLGHYCHLKKGGALVKPGDTVHTGDPIALSGNTGFSSGAHLHFCVFKTKDGKHRESIPVRFRDGNGIAITLTEGITYVAPARLMDRTNTTVAAVTR